MKGKYLRGKISIDAQIEERVHCSKGVALPLEKKRNNFPTS